MNVGTSETLTDIRLLRLRGEVGAVWSTFTVEMSGGGGSNTHDTKKTALGAGQKVLFDPPFSESHALP